MKGTSLKKICEESGEMACELIISKMLAELKGAVKTYYTGDNINIFAKMIISNNQEMKISELILCINNGINGKYSEPNKAVIYGDVTYDVIAGWINRYNNDKEDFLYQRHLERKNNPRGILDELAISNVELPQIGQIGNNALINTQGEKSSQADYDEQNKANNIVQRWVLQFDQIYERQKMANKNKLSYNGAKTIIRYGEKLSIEDYLYYKNKQREVIVEWLTARRL
jgi:hypothetical protein